MILTDTGPIVAMLDEREQRHEVCMAAALDLEGDPLATTWPVFTEAMHLLGRKGGFDLQSLLWEMYWRRDLLVFDLVETEVSRSLELMAEYQDAPMDLADATLIAIAESHAFRTIFTLDQGFRFFRLADGSVLEIIPDLPEH